jgi:transcriptional regulator with GAF, ATPase, and Fis domain
MPVRDSQGSLAALGTSDPRISTAPSAAATLGEDKSAQKLATLLEVSKGLGKSVDIDALLEKIVRYAYQILEVDRVAIALCENGQELVPKIARDKRGSEQPRAVPQSIARKVVQDKVAILSDNAGEDSRFGGQSILMQQIRSAICCPLVGRRHTASANTTSNISLRSPALRRLGSRTSNSLSASRPRCSPAKISRDISRRRLPSASRARVRQRG